TAVIGEPLQATLVLTTNARDAALSVPLEVTPHGGSLHVATAAVSFGQAQLTETLAQDLEISNTGDRAIHVALGAPSNTDFTDTWTGAPAAAAVAPAGALAGAVARFRPTAAATETAMI